MTQQRHLQTPDSTETTIIEAMKIRPNGADLSRFGFLPQNEYNPHERFRRCKRCISAFSLCEVA